MKVFGIPVLTDPTLPPGRFELRRFDNANFSPCLSAVEALVEQLRETTNDPEWEWNSSPAAQAFGPWKDIPAIIQNVLHENLHQCQECEATWTTINETCVKCHNCESSERRAIEDEIEDLRSDLDEARARLSALKRKEALQDVAAQDAKAKK